MELSKDYFLTLLYMLHPSEESMKSAALYIRLFKDDYISITEGIAYMFEISGPHHRLSLFYLINEVLQSDRSTGSRALRIELLKFIKDKFLEEKRNTHHYPNIERRLQELQTVWKSRGVVDFEEKYTPDEISQRVYDSFKDKKQLVNYLESVLDHYKSECST